MNKKIVVLNGSPRVNGNTSHLVQAFTEVAKKAGHQVTCFTLQGMNIHPCLGCMRGGKDANSPCVQKDDMDRIYAAYKDADVVVLASPLYYWTIRGQLKCAFDRLFAVAESNADYANPQKECALLMAAEGSDYEEVTFWYERMLKYLNWTDKGRVLCGGVLNIGDIDGNAKLEEAYALGEQL